MAAAAGDPRMQDRTRSFLRIKFFDLAKPERAYLPLPENFVFRPNKEAAVAASLTKAKSRKTNKAVAVVGEIRIPPASLDAITIADGASQSPPVIADAPPAAEVPSLYSSVANYEQVRALTGGLELPGNTPVFEVLRINASKQEKNAIRILCDGGHDYNNAVNLRPTDAPQPQLTYIDELKRKYLTKDPAQGVAYDGIVDQIFTDLYMARPEAIKIKLEGLSVFSAEIDRAPLKNNLVEIRNRTDPLFKNIFKIPLESGAFGFSVDASTFNPLSAAAAAASELGQTLNWAYFPTQEMDAASRPGPAIACKSGAVPVNLSQPILLEKFRVNTGGLKEYAALPPLPAGQTRPAATITNIFTVEGYYHNSHHVFYEQSGKNVVEIWHDTIRIATVKVSGGVSVNALSQRILGVIARGDADEAGSPVTIDFHVAADDNKGANALIVKQILDWVQLYFMALLWHYFRIKIVLITNDNFLLRIAKWLMLPWMIFMTKDGAQLYSFDNAAMTLSDADKDKIKENIRQIQKVGGANKPAIVNFLDEIQSIEALFTPKLLAEPFIYLLKQEAERIRGIITTELTTFQGYADPALITDQVLATSKFLINMNFIDYAYSLYESGFAQKISDFALGASRIASAVKDYRERKTTGANSPKLLSNIIQLLKVYIPADAGSEEKIGLWLTLLDFCDDSNPRLSIIQSIIKDLAISEAVDAAAEYPEGRDGTVLDCFQKYSAITMSKNSGAVPCIPFSYLEPGSEKVPCVPFTPSRFFPYKPLGKYAGFTNGLGGALLAAPAKIYTKASSISITRNFKTVYDEYLRKCSVRVNTYSQGLGEPAAAAQGGGALDIFQKGGAFPQFTFIDPHWAQKSDYDSNSYGIAEKFMTYKNEDDSIALVTETIYRKKNGKKYKSNPKITSNTLAYVLRQIGARPDGRSKRYTNSENLDRMVTIINTWNSAIEAVRAAVAPSPEPGYSREMMSAMLLYYETHNDNTYNIAQQFLTAAMTNPTEAAITARATYVDTIKLFLEEEVISARESKETIAGRHREKALDVMRASKPGDIGDEEYFDEMVTIASLVDLTTFSEEELADDGAGAASASGGAGGAASGGAGRGADEEEITAGNFRHIDFLLNTYLKIYHDLYRGTSIDGEYDLFLQEISVLRSKRYMGAIDTPYLWKELIFLILDETDNNPYSCISNFLLNTARINISQIIHLLYSRIPVIFIKAGVVTKKYLSDYVNAVYTFYFNKENPHVTFPGWGWDHIIDVPFVALEALVDEEYRPTQSIAVVERIKRLERRNITKQQLILEAKIAAATAKKEAETLAALVEFQEQLKREYALQAQLLQYEWELEELEDDEIEERLEDRPRIKIMRMGRRHYGGYRSARKSLRNRIGKKRATRKATTATATASSKSRRTRRRK